MDLLIAPYTVSKAQADGAPTTGVPGWATDGNPATNTPATQWPAYAFNAVQEELTNLIVGGGLALSRSDNSLVLRAVRAIASGVGLSAAGTKVVQASQPLAVAELGKTVILNSLSGSLVVTLPPAATAFRGARFEFINNGAIGASVVKQGSDNVLNTDGSLAAAGASVPVGAFLTLECVDSATWMIVNASPASASTSTAGVLRVSSTLQAQQMTDDGVAITPKKLKDAFLGGNQQLTTLGFQKMPGGTIEQWLRVPHTLGMGVPQAYTFPFAFPNATLGVSIVDISAPNSGAVVWAASQITASGLSMFWNYSNVTGGTSSREVFVRAIGW